MRILVIAESQSIGELLSRACTHIGLQVSVAHDSGSGLLQFGLHQPGLVILDLDGFETLRRIRDLSSVPVIALVNEYNEQVRIECLDCGADACVTKLVSIPLLQAKVRALLRRSQKPGPHVQHMKSALSTP